MNVFIEYFNLILVRWSMESSYGTFLSTIIDTHEISVQMGWYLLKKNKSSEIVLVDWQQ